MKPLADCRLYAFVDSAYLHGRKPSDVAEALCAGGADLVQLRAKDWTREQVLHTAHDLRLVTARYQAGLVVNDYLDVAQAVGADICHLGQEDFFEAGYSHVSQLPGHSGPGPRVGIGLSTHAPEQARRAIESGSDYIAIGPVFPTGTKPTARAVTLEYVRWAAASVEMPWFAIGGINLGNVAEVLKAGARRICVVSAILNSRDVKAECAKYRDWLSSAGSGTNSA